MILDEDVEYNFQIAKQIGAAGTGTYVGNTYRPTRLSVVQL
jgi:protein-disulfide isomerase